MLKVTTKAVFTIREHFPAYSLVQSTYFKFIFCRNSFQYQASQVKCLLEFVR